MGELMKDCVKQVNKEFTDGFKEFAHEFVSDILPIIGVLVAILATLYFTMVFVYDILEIKSPIMGVATSFLIYVALVLIGTYLWRIHQVCKKS